MLFVNGLSVSITLPYFDGLHSNLSVLSSLLQKRSHRLQLLLHLTHILCCAKELEGHHTAYSQIEFIKHMYTNDTVTVKQSHPFNEET